MKSPISTPPTEKTSFEDNPASIKYFVKRYLLANRHRIEGKRVVDVPAGNGVTTRILKDLSAVPLPFDLFPEYFDVEGVACTRANVLDSLPLEEGTADFLICQEGIEHFTDQFKALKEFNRVLKLNGSLIITTPNYSNLRSRLSYFLSESERFKSMMPPNEIDSIWMSDPKNTPDIYFGHVFLMGIQKLRLLARLAGFKITHVEFTRINNTSILLFPFAYPFILLANVFTFLKHVKKATNYSRSFQKEVYREVFRLSIDPKILIDGHLFVEFTKDKNFSDVLHGLKSVHTGFGLT